MHAGDLPGVDGGEVAKDRDALQREGDVDTTAVLVIQLACDEAALLGPINQAPRTVVVQLQALRQLGDVGPGLPRVALHRQQQKIVLRSQAGVSGSCFAGTQEAADGVVISGQRLVVSLRKSASGQDWRLCYRPRRTGSPIWGSKRTGYAEDVSAATIQRGADWRETLGRTLAATDQPGQPSPDLVLLFAAGYDGADLPAIVQEVQQATGATVVAGCSGQGVIGQDTEIEGEAALALMALPLPGATLRARHLTQEDVDAAGDPLAWHRLLGVAPEQVNGWLVFADPFHLQTELLIDELSAAYPGAPIVGGLASAISPPQATQLFINGETVREGAVVVAIGGDYTVQTVVSQGCDPIGEPWIITGVEGHVIHTISQRPAYEVLTETLRGLPPQQRARASRNLLVGLAMDEYRESFGRGDFLIRGLSGADPDSGALAIGAHPRLGQTIQFQIRDATAADDDLRQLLAEAQVALQGDRPIGALLCSCNGRGQGLFGSPSHDAQAVAKQLGPVPLAGFFCNGEIGPVGKGTFLHGFTASLALIVPKAPARSA